MRAGFFGSICLSGFLGKARAAWARRQNPPRLVRVVPVGLADPALIEAKTATLSRQVVAQNHQKSVGAIPCMNIHRCYRAARDHLGERQAANFHLDHAKSDRRGASVSSPFSVREVDFFLPYTDKFSQCSK